MDYISVIMAVFAILGAGDLIFGNRLGIGKEFEKGFMMLGPLALSMFGMIIILPFFSEIFKPFFNAVYNHLNIDPSMLTSMIFANDMGGASLAKEVAKDSNVGLFNGLVVGATMGATISFSIPFALSVVKKEKRKDLMLGLLCGIVTVPVGCLFGWFVSDIPLSRYILNLLPLFVFSAIIAAGLIFIPEISVKIFSFIGMAIKTMITIGLVLGIIKYATGFEVIKGLGTLEEGADIILKVAVVMSGAFPLLALVSRFLKYPIKKFGALLKINEKSTLGFISSLATNVTTYEMMNEMDTKGVALNSAFAVSASFVLADHLAFTLAFDPSYLLQMVVVKIASGVLAVLFTLLILKKRKKSAVEVK